MNHIISDALIRIQNAYMAHNANTELLYSSVIEKICTLLVADGYIEQYEILTDGVKKRIAVTLAYPKNGPAVTEVRIVSKPGQRQYVGKADIPYVLSGIGHAYVSTSKGICNDKEARKRGLGGELLFTVW